MADISKITVGSTTYNVKDAGASRSGHTHATSIASSSATNQITLSASTKYAITAGGTSYVFTTPADTNTWRPIGTGATDAAAGNHTHSTSIAASSGTNQVTLAANTKYAITAGGTSYVFTTPPDTNTWRPQTDWNAASTANNAILNKPSSLPASDVYAWAKASTKPSYTASEVGAVPTSRKVNGKALSADISLTAADVGAVTTDTKNTVGATQHTNPLYFVGVLSNSSQTYAQSYIDSSFTSTDGVIDCDGANIEGNTTIGTASVNRTLTVNGTIASTGAITQGGTAVVLTNDSRMTNARPASDVYSWAKASTKPSYAFNEISAGNATIGDGANSLFLRTNGTWASAIYHSTPNDECVVFLNKGKNVNSTANYTTSWIFAYGTPADRPAWTGLTPAMQIKGQAVVINKLLGPQVGASYNLDVNGTANATTLYENGTALSSKYLGISAKAVSASSADAVAWGNVSGKPSFATVATSGSYNDLSNKPTIPAAQVQTDWNATSGMGVLLNKPSSLPASDVYSWAKASTKPSYTYSEVGAAASSHTHSSVNDSGNSTATTFAYSKAGLSTTSWFAAWNSYELRAISPANVLSTIGAVPTSRTVNGKALSSNISLTAADVGAVTTDTKNTVGATDSSTQLLYAVGVLESGRDKASAQSYTDHYVTFTDGRIDCDGANIEGNTTIGTASANRTLTVNGSLYLGSTKLVAQATSSDFGGIKLGYTSSGNNRAVQLDSNGKAYVVQNSASVSLPITGYDDVVWRSYGADTDYWIEVDGRYMYFMDDDIGRSASFHIDNTYWISRAYTKHYYSSATTSSAYTCPAMNLGQIYIIKNSNSSWKIKLPSGGNYAFFELMRPGEGDYGAGGTTLSVGTSTIILIRYN